METLRYVFVGFEQLKKQLLAVEQLDVEQMEMLEEINTMFRQDYTLRRQLLLKRVDVTMQSFAWSKSLQVTHCFLWQLLTDRNLHKGR